MSKRDDGGPAFPMDFGDSCEQYGMSMRDYFAGQALLIAGCYAMSIGDEFQPEATAREAVAQKAYQIADAMLAERDK